VSIFDFLKGNKQKDTTPVNPVVPVKVVGYTPKPTPSGTRPVPQVDQTFVPEYFRQENEKNG
jgi:hypothetical protein